MQGKGDGGVKSLGFGMKMGAVIIALWLGILIPVLVLVRTLDYDHRRDDTPLDWFEVFYRTGSIIYGGGQVRSWHVHLPQLCSVHLKLCSPASNHAEAQGFEPGIPYQAAGECCGAVAVAVVRLPGTCSQRVETTRHRTSSLMSVLVCNLCVRRSCCPCSCQTWSNRIASKAAHLCALRTLRQAG